MLHHVSLGTTDIERAKAFYDAVLPTLGCGERYDVEFPDTGLIAMGYGQTRDRPQFWIQYPADRQSAGPGNGSHVALSAGTRRDVDAFYRAAIDAGATCAGEPGPRPHYTPDYYGAFVRDPDGHKIEACCYNAG